MTYEEILNELYQRQPDFHPFDILTWSGQFIQYSENGPSGISYFRGDFTTGQFVGQWVDCLLYRNESGVLQGILNHYPFEMPHFEKIGNINIFVDPTHYHRGIATALLDEAFLRFKINLLNQRYSPDGLKFIIHYLERKLK